MDGIHDLGGRQGFDRIRHTPNASPFHADWEKRANALYGLAVRAGILNMDEYRHAIERMSPRHYLSASYYERSLTGLADAARREGAGDARRARATRRRRVPVGSAERARSHECRRCTALSRRRPRRRSQRALRGPHPHARVHPRKRGVVVGESPPYPFPDAHAHGVAADDEPTYDVRFATSELWPNAADDAFVHVGVFRSYLLPAP
jgi:nitrile hydratase